MQKGILIVSRDNFYLHDILKIEGISSDCSERLDDSIDDYDLIIISNVKFTENNIVYFKRACKRRKKFIVINPDEKIRKVLDIGNAKKDDFVIWKKFNSTKLAVLNFDFLKRTYMFNEGKDATPDKNGVFRASSTTVVKGNEKLIPQADILRRKLVEVIEECLDYPLPRIWYLPNKKLAGVIFSHDSDEVSDSEFYRINELNKKNSVNSTTFMLIKTGSRECWQSYSRDKHDLQLHQAYFYLPNSPERLRGLSARLSSNFFSMKFQKQTLKIEKKILEELSGKKIVGIRNHGLFWHNKDDIPVWMHKSGIKFDSTLGAVYDYGYLHGTGMPFFLRMPKDFKRLDVLEFPLHIMDYVYLQHGEKTIQLTHKFLDNAIKYNSIITFDFHHKFLRGKILDYYLDTINYAKKKGLLIESMSYFNDFWRKRYNTDIMGIRFEKNRLSYNCSSEKLAEIDGLSHIVPMKFRNKKLKRILCEGKQIKFEKIGANSAYAVFESSGNGKVIGVGYG